MKGGGLETVMQGYACLDTWYLKAHLVYVGLCRIAKTAEECSRLSRKNTGMYCPYWLLAALLVFLSHVWVLVLGYVSM
jgi:hypothetical protein